MISFYLDLTCDGCGKGLVHMEVTHVDLEAHVSDRRQLTRGLNALAAQSRWTQDGEAHYCPACVIQREETA
jgi:hypothetical protein